jgi:hypothetical protein
MLTMLTVLTQIRPFVWGLQYRFEIPSRQAGNSLGRRSSAKRSSVGPGAHTPRASHTLISISTATGKPGRSTASGFDPGCGGAFAKRPDAPSAALGAGAVRGPRADGPCPHRPARGEHLPRSCRRRLVGGRDRPRQLADRGGAAGAMPARTSDRREKISAELRLRRAILV